MEETFLKPGRCWNEQSMNRDWMRKDGNRHSLVFNPMINMFDYLYRMSNSLIRLDATGTVTVQTWDEMFAEIGML